MAPVVEAYQAMRGALFLVAVTFAAEIGDVRRFDNPRQLMGFLGLVPRERSTGEAVWRAGPTLAGNRRARRVLVEAAWSYRHPARVSQTLQDRLDGLTVDLGDWWFNLRPSNTEPLLRLNLEARDAAACEAHTAEVLALVRGE